MLKKKNKIILDLGKQPVTNQFKKKFEKKIKKYDLKLLLELDTGLIRIKNPFPSNSLTPKVKWIKYNEPENHVEDLFNILCNKYLNKKSRILGISYKDGTLIERFKKKSFQATLIDPHRDLNLKKNEGIEVIQKKFDKKIAMNIIKKYGKQDIVIARHIWEHVYDLEKFSFCMKEIIKKNGFIVFEVPDYNKLLKNYDYTMVWEEHLFYFNRYTFLNSLRKYGFAVKFSKKIKYPNEDVVYAIVSPSINSKTKYSSMEVNKILYFTNNFKKNFNTQKKIIKNKLTHIFRNKSQIILYGAGHLGISFILYFNLLKFFSFAVDDNIDKDSYYIPGSKIKIIYSKKILFSQDDIVLISANQINEKKIVNYLISKNILKTNIYSIFSTSKYFIGR